MARVGGDLPEGTYVELVRSVFATLLPTTIMGMAFIGVGMLATSRVPDPWLAGLVIVGAILSLGRVALLTGLERRANDAALTPIAAQRIERMFGATYLGFAAVLGLFGARAFQVATPELHMLVTCLLVGYAAGVAAGISLRPWISIPSVLLAIAPAVVTAATVDDAVYRLFALVLTAMLAGGINSMMVRYRSETAKITMRRTFATLARQDPLTGLGNRLALAERFDELAGALAGGAQVAVHCLDLDRFKPVNDRHGHPAGDALLQAVAGRLRALMRAGDFAARVGGDEFVVLQGGIHHAGEAELMAHRIARALGEPYGIAGTTVAIGSSVGYALTGDCGASLERLTAAADRALYAVKQAGGGVAPYEPHRQAPAQLLTA